MHFKVFLLSTSYIYIHSFAHHTEARAVFTNLDLFIEIVEFDRNPLFCIKKTTTTTTPFKMKIEFMRAERDKSIGFINIFIQHEMKIVASLLNYASNQKLLLICIFAFYLFLFDE